MLNIKDFRERKGLTQQDLANLLGIHKVTVSKYEREIVHPDYEKLVKIAIVLDTTPNELLGYYRKYQDFTDYLMSLKR